MSMVRRKIASKTKEISLLGEHSRTTNKEFVDYAIKDMSEFSDEVGKIVAPAMAFASVDDLIVESAPPDIACEVLRITAGRPCIIAGQGSSGKTWLAQELLLSTLLGKRLFGGRYRPAQRVVNLDYEMTKQPLMRRYKALLPKHDDEESICYLTDKKLMEAAFLVSSIPDEKPMMNDSKFCSILDKCLQGATICVIDSLRASLPGIDENDSRIGQYINALAKVSSNTGCAIVLLHHAAKSKEGGINIRGSSAIRDACGSVWTIDSKSRTDKIMNLSKPPADIPAYDFEIKWRFERFESTPTGIYQDVRLELVK
jgi:RecA-family ATPase